MNSEPQSCDAEAEPSVKSLEKYKDLCKQSRCAIVEQWSNSGESREAIKEQWPLETAETRSGHTYKDKWSSDASLCRASTSKKVSDSSAGDHSEAYSYCSQCGSCDYASEDYYDYCEKPCSIADSSTGFRKSRWKVIKKYFWRCRGKRSKCSKNSHRNKKNGKAEKNVVVEPLQKSSCHSSDQS